MQVVPCELIQIECRLPAGTHLVVLNTGRAFACPSREDAQQLRDRLEAGAAEPAHELHVHNLTVAYVPDAYGIPRRVGAPSVPQPRATRRRSAR